MHTCSAMFQLALLQPHLNQFFLRHKLRIAPGLQLKRNNRWLIIYKIPVRAKNMAQKNEAHAKVKRYCMNASAEHPSGSK